MDISPLFWVFRPSFGYFTPFFLVFHPSFGYFPYLLGGTTALPCVINTRDVPSLSPSLSKHLKVGLEGKSTFLEAGIWRMGMSGSSWWLCWSSTCGTGAAPLARPPKFGFWESLGALKKLLRTPQLCEGDKIDPAGVTPALGGFHLHSLWDHQDPGGTKSISSSSSAFSPHPRREERSQSRARELPRLPGSGLTARE